MKAVIYGQKWKDKDTEYLRMLLSKLDNEAIDYRFAGNVIHEPHDIIDTDKLVENHDQLVAFGPEVLISLGGDGTILAAVTLINKAEIPILGRLMLKLLSNHQVFDGKNYALNDCTIQKRDTASMIVLHTYVDGIFLNSYWADGLIIATPTGSTGYSLSCGGPIIFPTADNFILTPVAPHNLNVRPVVLSSDHKLTFRIEGRSDNYLCTLDSRSETITEETEITIVKNDFRTKIIRLNEDNFMKTIRNKLNWGVDSRNY